MVRKYQGLHFVGNTLGPCPAGGTHITEGGGDYRLVENDPTAFGQSEWRWCSKCQSLHFAGSSSQGVCPAGGGHISEGSGNYVVLD